MSRIASRSSPSSRKSRLPALVTSTTTIIIIIIIIIITIIIIVASFPRPSTQFDKSVHYLKYVDYRFNFRALIPFSSHPSFYTTE
ncbi:hypothetical protein E2C01_040404 [Portunus trituberculatus]|uniref:Uncharacterized protein n=1 Tax=Portunus trituberculatus TaxID=210409 RepID=A0A5B7FN78_PORTR|nr:hypothetical protein [Portunus trituberculatus]